MKLTPPIATVATLPASAAHAHGGATAPLTLVFEGKGGKSESVTAVAPVGTLTASRRPASGQDHP